MTNSYFNHSSPLARHTLARADAVNTIAAAIAAGFEKLPTPENLARGRVTYAEATGTANALVVSMPTTMTAYQDGAFIVVKVASTNTGAATINVDGLGVRSIVTQDGSELAAGDLTAGDFVTLVYDDDNTNWIQVSYLRSFLSRVTDAQAAVEAIFLGNYANDTAADASGKPISDGVLYYKTDAPAGLRLRSGGAWTDAALSASDFAALAGALFTGTLGVRDISEGVAALSGATPSLSVTAAQVFTLTTSANTTVSVTNAPSGRAWARTIHLTLGGTHAFAITGADWGDEGAPVLASGDQVKIQLDGIGTTFSAAVAWLKTA